MEGKMMTVNKRYYRDVKKLFPIYAKKERFYLKQLKEQINEYDDATYDELVNNFGDPIEIVKSYYETVNSRYLLKRINLKRIITMTCILVLMLSTLYLGYRTYSLHEAVNNFKTGVPADIEETIEVIE